MKNIGLRHIIIVIGLKYILVNDATYFKLCSFANKPKPIYEVYVFRRVELVKLKLKKPHVLSVESVFELILWTNVQI